VVMLLLLLLLLRPTNSLHRLRLTLVMVDVYREIRMMALANIDA
jgi:hypothetical protein